MEKVIDELPEFPSFRGEAWEVIAAPRPFLNHEQWVKFRKLGKARAAESGLNPRTGRQRQELYWFALMCVGAALRVGEAYSLRWRDCELIKQEIERVVRGLIDDLSANVTLVLVEPANALWRRDDTFHIERANQIGSEGTIAACVPQTLAIRSLALSRRQSVE